MKVKVSRLEMLGGIVLAVWFCVVQCFSAWLLYIAIFSDLPKLFCILCAIVSGPLWLAGVTGFKASIYLLKTCEYRRWEK